MRIIFWSPSRQIGGTEFLILKMVTQLSAQNVACAVIDYPDGFVPRQLKQCGVLFEHILCDNNQNPITDGIQGGQFSAIIVFQSHLMRLSQIKFFGAAKLLLWEVHKVVWMPWLSDASTKGKLGRLLKKKMVEFLLDSGSIAVLEQDSIRMMHRCGFANADQAHVIRIPMELTANRLQGSRSGLYYVSVGRAVAEKLAPAVWAFSKIDALKNGRAKFRIATDDAVAAMAFVKSVAPKLLGKIEIFDSLSGDALDRWLVDSAHIYIGMGTSVLDAAKLGIPAIIVDANLYADGYPVDARVRIYGKDDYDNLGTVQPSNDVGVLLEDAVRSIDADYVNYSVLVRETVYMRNDVVTVANALQRVLSNQALTVGQCLRSPVFLVANLLYAAVLTWRRMRVAD